MVEVRSKMAGLNQRKEGDPPAGTVPGADAAKKNPRLERLAAIARENQLKLVRVEPTKDKYRKTLKPLPSDIGFRETGSAVWPAR